MSTKSYNKILIISTLVVAIIFGFFTYFLNSRIDDIALRTDTLDSWFDGDLHRVASNMSLRYSDHSRNRVHPLFSIAAFLPTKITASLIQTSLDDAVRIVSSLMAAIWAGLLFLVFRGMGCKLIDSWLFIILSGVSAASIFWLSVPETYVWGSITILIALGFTLLVQKYQFAWYWYAIISAITFSMTITNWMAGLLVTLTSYPGVAKIQDALKRSFKNPRIQFVIPEFWGTWKGFFMIQFSAMALVLFIALIQRRIFPSAAINFFTRHGEELDYIAWGPGGPFESLISMVMHTIIMPEIQIVPKPVRYDILNWPFMLTQLSKPGSASIWGSISVVLWLSLLLLGVWSFFKFKGHSKFRFVLGLTLLGQVSLHLIYGRETFLYSLHLAPLLVLIVSFVSLTSLRLFGLFLAGMLILVLGLNNFQQFQVAANYFEQYGPPRQAVIAEMQRRPTDPWPRGIGHVVLGLPGSYEEEKAYHEPGGSFSPVASSFGVSFWVVDSSGSPIATSDDISLDSLQQQFIDDNSLSIPGVLTKTDFYQSIWQTDSDKQWKLKLNPTLSSDSSLAVIIRSIGPAGGPIDSLDWDGQQLLIQQNRSDLCSIDESYLEQLQQVPLEDISHSPLASRCKTLGTEELQWKLTFDSPPKLVNIGHEGDQGWTTAIAETTHWQGEDGWGFARFEFDPTADISLNIERLNPVEMPLLQQSQTPFSLNLPNQQFIDSLKAQIAHLKMSLVDNQSRPGEPINYPLSWQRNGAYTVVALARVGQIDIAKQLALYFAENDFFGGFGSEADAPGLSLWALEQVSVQAQDPTFDQKIWPHVKRKAEWIERMLSTNETIYEPVVEPVYLLTRFNNLNLVTDPPQNGLIMGRIEIDRHRNRPILFLNAVSYRGLLAASELALRLEYTTEQAYWQEQATQLQKAWSQRFRSTKDDNQRTCAVSLWPTWAASEDLELYKQKLSSRLSYLESSKENGTYSPELTYFEIAEAHQWLYLGETKPVWDALEWFWQHQASPGLYTWWEGDGEENTSHFWKFIRGWVDPPHVTPHYWTASEMLLLQLDTLAYIDRNTATPELVVAGGIPENWFDQPMSVENLPIEGRLVSWFWDGTALRVEVEGPPISVRVGPNVPQDAGLLM